MRRRTEPTPKKQGWKLFAAVMLTAAAMFLYFERSREQAPSTPAASAAATSETRKPAPADEVPTAINPAFDDPTLAIRPASSDPGVRSEEAVLNELLAQEAAH